MIENLEIKHGQIIPFVNLVNEICEMGIIPEQDVIEHWLQQPRQFLDNKSPQDLVNEDNMDKVWDLLRFIGMYFTNSIYTMYFIQSIQ